MRVYRSKVLRTVLCIITAAYLAIFHINSFVSYAYTQGEGVALAEDTRKTLEKGTKKYNGVDYSKAPHNYNALYYYLNYADLREEYGPDPNMLIMHYATYGIKEKRVANKLIVKDADPTSSSFEYVVPTSQKTQKKADGMVVISGNVHSNGGMTREQEIAARSVAYQLAQSIYDIVKPKHDAYKDGDHIKMVAYATGIVKAYCDLGTYTTEGKIYRTAYGVFIGGQYSCAGATRALGLILDYLDAIATDDPPLKWVHVNENKWDDQWCQIVCDKHEAYADPIQPWAGYGKHPNQGGKKKDIKQYYDYASESDVITVKRQKVD